MKAAGFRAGLHMSIVQKLAALEIPAGDSVKPDSLLEPNSLQREIKLFERAE